jgi:hypothetical protein
MTAGRGLASQRSSVILPTIELQAEWWLGKVSQPGIRRRCNAYCTPFPAGCFDWDRGWVENDTICADKGTRMVPALPTLPRSPQ